MDGTNRTYGTDGTYACMKRENTHPRVMGKSAAISQK
jgi:hypothetical protein